MRFRGGFARLLALRWMGGAADGLFQSALASFLLFSPERQPDAVSAAFAFAVVLLPYSLIGPLVGTILDRISRQRVIFFSHLLRAGVMLFIAFLIGSGQTGVTLTILVLIIFGINRLILAGLSAGLPLVVSKKDLIASNALAVTGGTVLVVIGGGIGIGIRNLLSSEVLADSADSILILTAMALCIFSALLALLLTKNQIGPLAHEKNSGGVAGRFVEMKDAFIQLRKIRDVFLGIFATGVQRGGLTALTLMALILERNTFNPVDKPEAGFAGFALAIAVAGIGIAIGAIISPFGVARFGRHRWIRGALFSSSILPFVLSIEQSELILIATGFAAGLCGQCVKVTNDALTQSKIVDDFRGRVFALYDVVVNCAIVSGALIAALLLPATGEGWVLPFFVGASYVLVSLFLLRPKNFHADTPTTR